MVGKAFFAGGGGAGVVVDAVGEVICFVGELIRLFAGAGLFDVAADRFAGILEAVVEEGWLDLEIPLRAADVEIARSDFAVACAAGGEDVGWEFDSPLDGLFDGGEAGSGDLGRGLGGEGGWLFAGDPADGIEGIDTEIEEGTAASDFFVESPALEEGGVEAALEALEFADGAGAGEVADLLPHGVVVDPVGNHEFDVGVFARLDHGAALGGVEGHGLLAEDVFARFGGADGVLGVHVVGEADVDGVDVGILSDGVEVFVVIDRGLGNLELLLVFGGLLVGVAGDEAGDGAFAGLGNGAHEDVGDGAEAHGGEADAAGGVRVLRPGGEGGGGGGEGGEFGEVAAVHVCGSLEFLAGLRNADSLRE